VSFWEKLAWWAMARAVRRYKYVHHPRYSAAKTLHRRLDGVLHNEWPDA
jgi:hypothetical protein